MDMSLYRPSFGFRFPLACENQALVFNTFAGSIFLIPNIGKTDEPLKFQELTPLIENALKEIETIKPGMKRKDLLVIFTTEGGISNRLHRTYVYQKCMYIKVDVEFTPADQPEDNLKENPEDVIKEISRPYLEWGVID